MKQTEEGCVSPQLGKAGPLAQNCQVDKLAIPGEGGENGGME